MDTAYWAGKESSNLMVGVLGSLVGNSFVVFDRTPDESQSKN
jgi:hypothetical protein